MGVFKCINVSISQYLPILFHNFFRICWTISRAVNAVFLWLRGTTTPCRGHSPPVRCYKTWITSCYTREWLTCRAQHRFVFDIPVFVPQHHKSIALPTRADNINKIIWASNYPGRNCANYIHPFVCCKINNVIPKKLKSQITTTSTSCPPSQALLKEVGEWRRQEEANNCLRRRFEESRQELERVLKKAQGCLKENGDAEELLKKHSVRSVICFFLYIYKFVLKILFTNNRYTYIV